MVQAKHTAPSPFSQPSLAPAITFLHTPPSRPPLIASLNCPFNPRCLCLPSLAAAHATKRELRTAGIAHPRRRPHPKTATRSQKLRNAPIEREQERRKPVSTRAREREAGGGEGRGDARREEKENEKEKYNQNLHQLKQQHQHQQQHRHQHNEHQPTTEHKYTRRGRG